MSKTPSILAIDQGTTGTTCLVVANDGRILGKGYEELPQYFPRPGWVEHDAVEIWNVTKRVASRSTRINDRKRMFEDWVSRTRERRSYFGIERRLSQSTGRSSGRIAVLQTCAPILKKKGHEPEVRRQDWSRARSVFLRHQVVMAISRTTRATNPVPRRGILAAGTIDSWLITCLTQGAIHATDPYKCVSDPSLRSLQGDLGSVASGSSGDTTRDSSRSETQLRGLWNDYRGRAWNRIASWGRSG